MKYELFSFGPITVYGYGLMIGIGIIAAFLVADYRAKKMNLSSDRIFTLALLCVAGGLVGAKLFYVLTQLKEVLTDPKVTLSPFDGFVVYGGIIGGILSGFLYCRITHINFFKYFDLVMPSVALAQGFGRIGCHLAGCCYGMETKGPLGIIFPATGLAPAGVPLVPTQLISSGLDFIHFFVLLFIAMHKKTDGQVAGFYLIFYSVGRFVLEFYRGDLIRGSVGTLSTSQFISIFIFVIGWIIVLRKADKAATL